MDTEAPKPVEPRRITTEEAAKIAGVSKSTVYNWCTDRRVAHYRFAQRGKRHGKLLVDADDLERLMRTFRVEAIVPPSDSTGDNND